MPESLSNSERQAVRWLAHRADECFDRAALVKATGLSFGEYEHLLPMLADRGHVEIIPVSDGIPYGNFQVGPSIRAFDRQLDQPAQPGPTFLQRHPYLGPIIGAVITGTVAVILYYLGKR